MAVFHCNQGVPFCFLFFSQRSETETVTLLVRGKKKILQRFVFVWHQIICLLQCAIPHITGNCAKLWKQCNAVQLSVQEKHFSVEL